MHGYHLLVADGAAGLVILDVGDPQRPTVTAVLDLNGANPAPNDAWDVFPMAHFSNPPPSGMKPFEMMAYVADGRNGVRVVNLNVPSQPYVVATYATTDARAVFAKSHYVTGDAVTPSVEREYLFVADGVPGVRVADVTDPSRPWRSPGCS